MGVKGKSPSKERVLEVMNEVDKLDLSDGAHWQVVHKRLGLKCGDVFEIIGDDPAFFGAKPVSGANSGREQRTSPTLSEKIL